MSEWQEIETAPKDGTEILAWNGETCLCVVFHDGAWVENYDYAELVEIPTHWMPLPKPPGQ